MKDVVNEVDRRSASTEFGRLQYFRKLMKGLGRRPGSVPFAGANSPDWAHHQGGFNELQFNLGVEEPITDTEGDLRYGIAFSFQPNRSLQDVTVLKPKAYLFNDYIQQNRDDLSDYWMWRHSSSGRSIPDRPSEILDEHMAPGTFIFMGLATKLSNPDYERVIKTFNRLLPIYFYVEGGRDAVSAPSKDMINFKCGFSLGVTETVSHSTSKSVPMHLRHRLIQKALYDLLVAEYGENNVGGEQPSEGGGLIDLVVQTKKKRLIFEVKTASTARGCIREALGQILDYAFWPGSRTVDELVIVGEFEATPTEIDYISVLSKSLPVSMSYRCVPIGR